MALNKCKMILVAVVYICCQSIVIAGNEEIVNGMSQVIRSDKRLTPQRQEDMCQIVSEVLSAFADLGSDKSNTAKGHLQTYLDGIVEGTQYFNDRQFEVTKQTFTWNLGNYARMPSIMPEKRKQAKQSILGLKEGIKTFIETTYTDTPETVRCALFTAVQEKTESHLCRIGNYFYPHFLYSNGLELAGNDVVRLLRRNPFVGDNSTKFAPVASILADESIPRKSREVHVGFFINHQSYQLADEIQQLYSTLFTMSEEGMESYLPPPQELVQAKNALVQELQIEAEEKAKHMHAKTRHQVLVREILDETGIEIVDGIVYLPSEHLAPAGVDSSVSSPSHIDDTNGTPVREVVIPNAHRAAKRGEPFILDFASGALLYIQLEGNIASKEVHSYLNRLGKGDLAWDDSFFALRNSKMDIPRNGERKLLEYSVSKYCRVYKLDNRIELPYVLRLVNNERGDYSITVLRIGAHGIRIAYRRTDPGKPK